MYVCIDAWSICSILCNVGLLFFFFKQKTAYEMRISDWSSDVCSSDLFVYRGALVREDEVRETVVTRQPHDPVGLDLECIGRNAGEIGRASCRERVCQYV